MVLLIYIQLLILLLRFSFVFVYWRYLFLVLPINQFVYHPPPLFLRAFLTDLNFMARKMFPYVACLASLLNCIIIIYIFIYEHFFLANNKIYKLICIF
jgi:hypothetical protein